MVLDYGDPDNPGFIRAIHDEVREIAPGLFFGPACWKGAGGKTTVVLVVRARRARGGRVAFELRDARHVLVTGAAGAIGGALAELLSARAPEAQVTLVDRDREGVEAIARRLRGRAAVWDLSEPGELDAAVGDRGEGDPGRRADQLRRGDGAALVRDDVVEARGQSALDRSGQPATPHGARGATDARDAGAGSSSTSQAWRASCHCEVPATTARRRPASPWPPRSRASSSSRTACRCSRCIPGPCRSGLERRARAQVRGQLAGSSDPDGTTRRARPPHRLSPRPPPPPRRVPAAVRRGRRGPRREPPVTRSFSPEPVE